MLKINQCDIKRIVAESIRRILNEAPYSQFPVGSEEWRKWVLETFTPSNIIYWKAMHPEWSKEQCNNVVHLYEKVKKIYPSATFSVEHKIDGLSLTLVYENGALKRALPYRCIEQSYCTYRQ